MTIVPQLMALALWGLAEPVVGKPRAFSMSESRIQSLVDDWFDQHELGRDVAIAELCQGSPELADELQRRIAVIRKFEHLADVETVSSLENTVSSLGRSGSAPVGTLSSGELPAMLGGFTLLSILGEGGMGAVYLAEDAKLGRKVAIKVIRRDLAATEIARARFLREARSMAAVDHEHVMSIYAVGEDRQTPFFVMPVLKGESLELRLRRERNLSVGEACRIGREIAEGLGAAHQLGLIHRDIKPSNVWLEGRRAKVKILDFGLARNVDQEQGVTASGAVLGTPAYMAPEQAAGLPATVRSDLFSLGALLYRMMTGEQPFAGESIIATLNKLANHHPAPPLQANSDIPLPLSDLILCLIAKEPSGRPASAEDVSNALSDFVDGAQQPSGSTPFSTGRSGETQASPLPTQPSRGGPRSSMRRLALGAAGAMAAIFLGVIVITIQKRDGTRATVEIPGDVQHVDVTQGGKSIGRMTFEPKAGTDAGQPPLPNAVSKSAEGSNQSATARSNSERTSEANGFYAELNGQSSWIETPVMDDGEGALTIEMWAWQVPRLFYPCSEFFFHNDTSGLETDQGRPTLKVAATASGLGTVRSKSELALPVDRFAHLAVVLDDQLENRLYVDGRRAATARRSAPREASRTPWTFGAAHWHAPEMMFQGAVDEIHIRRGAHYTSDFVPSRRQTPDPSTLALYHLDESDGERVVDASGGDRHGRLVAGHRRAAGLPPQVILPPPDCQFQTPQNIPNGMQAAAWAPDSETLAFGGWDRFFVAHRGQEVLDEYVLDLTGLQRVAFVNETSVVVGTEYGVISKAWLNRPSEERIAWRVNREGQDVTHLAVSSDGGRIVALLRHRSEPAGAEVLILDAKSGNIERTWKPASGEVRSAAILPDSTLRLAAYESPSAENQNMGAMILETRSLASNELLRTTRFDSPYWDSNHMRSTSGGRFLSIAHFAHRCMLIDARDDTMKFFTELPSNLTGGCATDDGRLLFASDQSGLSIFDTDSKRRIGYAAGWSSGLSLSPDDRWIVCTRGDIARIWSVEKMSQR